MNVNGRLQQLEARYQPGCRRCAGRWRVVYEGDAVPPQTDDPAAELPAVCPCGRALPTITVRYEAAAVELHGPGIRRRWEREDRDEH